MRGEKIDETLVSGARREIDPVDEAGERRFLIQGPWARRDLRRRKRKAADAQARFRVGETEAEAFSERQAPSRAKTETGNLRRRQTWWSSPARLFGTNDRAPGLGGAPCEFHEK